MWEPCAKKETDSKNRSFGRGSAEVRGDTYPMGKVPRVETAEIGRSPSFLLLSFCAMQVYGTVMNNLCCQLNLEPTKIQVSRNSCEGLEGLPCSEYLKCGSPLMWKAHTRGKLLLFACFPSLLPTSSSVL